MRAGATLVPTRVITDQPSCDAAPTFISLLGVPPTSYLTPWALHDASNSSKSRYLIDPLRLERAEEAVGHRCDPLLGREAVVPEAEILLVGLRSADDAGAPSAPVPVGRRSALLHAGNSSTAGPYPAVGSQGRPCGR